MTHATEHYCSGSAAILWTTLSAFSQGIPYQVLSVSDMHLRGPWEVHGVCAQQVHRGRCQQCRHNGMCVVLAVECVVRQDKDGSHVMYVRMYICTYCAQLKLCTRHYITYYPRIGLEWGMWCVHVNITFVYQCYLVANLTLIVTYVRT